METHTENEALVVRTIGEISFFNVTDFISLVDNSINVSDCRHIVIDAEELNFIDSAAIGALMSLHRRISGDGGSIRFARPRAAVMQTIYTLKLSGLLRCFGSLEKSLDYSESEEPAAGGAEHDDTQEGQEESAGLEHAGVAHNGNIKLFRDIYKNKDIDQDWAKAK
ncbi:MAG: STAS domain-containing protein [Planctomycetales bacterium]|nr:STAS domain-containing protein [bacterium]UNM09858.1 MAG: STAS domain-containing protein [Planctomycetales bacterium]